MEIELNTSLNLSDDLLSDMSDESDKEIFDFKHPEDVMFEVDYRDIETYERFKWNHYEIVDTLVLSDGKITGAASYEYSYGGFLNYTVEGLIDPSDFGYQVGLFIVEDITGVYTRGDGWTTDDDMDFYCGIVRPATIEEICEHWCGLPGVFWDRE
jgi:hypothetical protein